MGFDTGVFCEMNEIGSARREKFLLIAAAVFAVIVTFMNLGSDGMYAAQEGRTAIIVRNMLLSGNCMDTDVPYRVLYEKPIGHYWLCLPFAKLFRLDAPDPLDVPVEWALRLPSALSALLAIALAAVLAARIYRRRTAAVVMVVLSSMMTFCNLAHVAHIDMPLAAAFTAAMYFLYVGYLEEMRCNNWIYGFYAALGWAAVLKGPVAVILAGLVVLAMMLKTRRWRMLWEMRPLTGGALLLLLALPWYVAETVRTNGEFYREFIVNQNLRRFTGIGSTYRDGEWMPIWYYLPRLFTGALPWSLAVIPALIVYRKKLLKLEFRTETVFLALWFLTGFVFFSLSALKRGDYLAPIYPPLAILTARAVELACERMPPLSRRWRWGFGALVGFSVVLLTINFTGVLIRFGRAILDRRIRWISKGDGNNIIAFSEYVNGRFLLTVAVFVLMLALIGWCGRLMEKRRYFAGFQVVTLVVLVIFTAYYWVLSPGTDRLRSLKPLVRESRKIPIKKAIYTGNYRAEVAFFLNRDFVYDAEVETDIPPEFDTVITSPSKAKMLNPALWKEVLRTESGHKYPLILLQRTAPSEAH